METTGQEFMGKLLAQANADPAFRHKLETDPAPIFAAVGLELAPGVRFVCETATRETAAAIAARSSEREIHIPILGQAGELSDEDLAQVNGGGLINWTLDFLPFNPFKDSVPKEW